MPDLSAARLPGLRSSRIEGLSSADGFVYPQYGGQSILNIPSSICSWLGAPQFGAPALNSEIIASLANSYKRVIFLLVDALALHRLQTWMRESAFAVWQRQTAAGVLAPLTSVTPSTTCAALTSLWTGRSPAEHGTVGYELWLREYGVVANMILHSPFSFNRDNPTGSLRSAGFDPETVLGLPTLGTHLAAAGVRSYALQHFSIIDSGLSQMFFPSVELVPYLSPNDGWDLTSVLFIGSIGTTLIRFRTRTGRIAPESKASSLHLQPRLRVDS